MNRVAVNDIEIYYKEDFDGDIEYITKVIKNNYSIVRTSLGDNSIIALFDTDIKGVFSCSNIIEFIEKIIIYSYLNDNIVEKVFDDNYVYNSYRLLLETVLSKEEDNDFSKEDILKGMAIRYYLEKDNVEEFISFAKDIPEDRSEEIVDWFREQARYKLYNDLIHELYDYFPEDKEQFEKEVRAMLKFVSSFSREELYECKNEVKLDKERYYLSDEERNKLFIEYLKYINAPKDWFMKYDDLVSNNKIKKGDKSFFLEGVITLELDNTLDDLVKLAHEFSHFICNSNVNITLKIDEWNAITTNGSNEKELLNSVDSFAAMPYDKELKNNSYINVKTILASIFAILGIVLAFKYFLVGIAVMLVSLALNFYFIYDVIKIKNDIELEKQKGINIYETVVLNTVAEIVDACFIIDRSKKKKEKVLDYINSFNSENYLNLRGDNYEQ